MQLVKVFIGNRWRSVHQGCCEVCGAPVQKSLDRAKKNPKLICNKCNCKNALIIKYKDHEKKRNTPIYNTWCHMVRRCYYKKHKKYHRYGGRGISVCSEWMDFEVFRSWAAKSWFPKATLDRIDNDGNYEPNNCQWLTASENSKKRWKCN